MRPLIVLFTALALFLAKDMLPETRASLPAANRSRPAVRTVPRRPNAATNDRASVQVGSAGLTSGSSHVQASASVAISARCAVHMRTACRRAR